MKYLQFTHVDSVTGISVKTEPARNGPAFPAVDGLKFAWARESRYPTPVPEFFGTCPDDSNVMIDGVVREFAQTDYEQMLADELKAMKIKSISPILRNLKDIDMKSIRSMREAIILLSEKAQITLPKWMEGGEKVGLVDYAAQAVAERAKLK